MTKFALIAHYQYYENYAVHDGGECWKAKGGHEEVIKESLTLDEVQKLGMTGLTRLVEESKYGMHYSNEAASWDLINWHLTELSDHTVENVFEQLKSGGLLYLDCACLDYESEFAFNWALEKLKEQGRVVIKGKPGINETICVCEPS